jgi:carboxyl-terminal processing protease
MSLFYGKKYLDLGIRYMKRFKFIFLLVLNVIVISNVQSQFPVSIDVMYDFIKSNSIHRNKVDWGKVDNQFFRSVSSARTLNDTMNAFIDVLKSLDDVHSQICLNNQYYGYWHANEGPDAARLSKLVEQARETAGQIKSAILYEQFAYVRVPSVNAYGAEEIQRFSRMLRDSIDQMWQRKVKGFIIDLRLNTGGNLYPMLSGLGNLIGDGDIAYEVEIDYYIARAWKIENGNFIINDFPVTNLDNAPLKGLDEIPVAILIGPVTASSGSNVAIAFKGRPHTFFIGEPTADGYATSNGYFQFAPNLFMNFAVAFVADRNLNLYPSLVEPNIMVKEGDDFENLMEDQKIKRALIWLNGIVH